jgi:excisionase family DNA binding protein
VKKLNRVQEAAEAWNVSTKTVWNWIAQGRVGVVRLGRAVRIQQSEIDRLIDDGFTPARRSA